MWQQYLYCQSNYILGAAQKYLLKKKENRIWNLKNKTSYVLKKEVCNNIDTVTAEIVHTEIKVLSSTRRLNPIFEK